MRVDNYGQVVLSENDIMDLYMQDPYASMPPCITDCDIHFDQSLKLSYVPAIKKYQQLNISLEDFDIQQQRNWHMPEEYYKFNVVEFILDKCVTDEQFSRVEQELLLYAELDLIPLLQYLKYLVDTMREHGIIWGVGRGSSVNSYVLYLLEVHRIDSLKWDLDIHEFLKL